MYSFAIIWDESKNCYESWCITKRSFHQLITKKCKTVRQSKRVKIKCVICWLWHEVTCSAEVNHCCNKQEKPQRCHDTDFWTEKKKKQQFICNTNSNIKDIALMTSLKHLSKVTSPPDFKRFQNNDCMVHSLVYSTQELNIHKKKCRHNVQANERTNL